VRLSHLQQVADQRRAELQQRARSSSSALLTGRCTWHSASSRTCAKISQRRQHKGQAHEKAPALPLGGGGYDRSLGVGVPPDSPPKPVTFGFCFSGNTWWGVFSFLYIAVI